MNTEQLIAQAQDTIKIARLSASLKLATDCTARKPADCSPLSNTREVVLSVPNDTAADALVDAIRSACK